MAFNAAELSVKLSIDTADLDRGLREADARLRQFGRQADASGRAAAGGMGQLTGALGGVRSALQAVGVGVTLAGIARLGADAVKSANDLEKTEATVRALAGSTERYAQVLAVARQGQLRYGGTLQESLAGLGTLVNASNRYGIELQKLDNISRRLAIVDPIQGVAGANYALKELLSNTGATATLSLRNRFELDRSVIAGLEDQSVSASDKIKILDSALTQLGISNEVLSNRTQTTAAAYDRLGSSADNAKTALGGMIAEALTPAAKGLTELFNAIAGGLTVLSSVEGKMAALSGQMLASSDGYGEFAAMQTNAANELAKVGQVLPTLNEAAYNYAKSLMASGVAANEAAAKAVALREVFAGIQGSQVVLREDTALSAKAIADLGLRLAEFAAGGAGNEATVLNLATALRTGAIDADYFQAAVVALTAEMHLTSQATAETAQATTGARASAEELAAALQLVSAGAPQAQAGLLVAAGGADAVKIAAAEAAGEVSRLLTLMANVGRTSMPGASIGGTNTATGRPSFGRAELAGRAAEALAGRAGTARVLARASTPAPVRTGRGGGGAGAARISEAERTAERLIEIEEQTAERLREIDERLAQQRIEAQRRLAAELITSANEFAVNAQSNDLELIGATGKDAERLADRERAEAQARISYVKAIDEAKQRAAEGDADLARETYETRQDQIRQQQALDEEYYRRARELPAEQQEALKKEYDEATAAITQSAADRIALAEAEAQARQQAAEAEKAAVIASGAEQAAALQRTGESATTARGKVDDLGGAIAALPSSKTTTIYVDTVERGKAGGGEPAAPAAPATGGKGGATRPAVKAAGGARFVTEGPTSLIVGDNPGGRELVTVTPLSGRGQTRYSGNVIALAGGGEVDAAGEQAKERVNQGSTPEPATATAKPRKGKSIADMDRDWAAAQAKIRALEEQYLFNRERLNEDHFRRQLQEDLWQMQSERYLRREFEKQQQALDRQQQAREKELLDQARQAAAQQLERQVIETEQSIGSARLDALNDAERRYLAKGTQIVAEGAQAQNEVAAFWQTVRLADTSAAYQEERQRINDEYERRREDAVQRVRAEGEDISAEAEEAARLRAEREFEGARDALEDQQFIDERLYGRLWDRRAEQTERALETELKVFQDYWKQRLELIPGGADAWSNLQKRADGGPVRAGMPYIVGERQPELFVPDTNGYILPSVAGGGTGGASIVFEKGSIVVGPGVNVAQFEAAMKRVADRALKEEADRAAKALRTGSRGYRGG